MSTPSKLRHLVAAVLVGVLVGGGLMATTPAGAQVAQVATNWKKIWKKKLAPQADKRYYKKADADARYQPKGSYEPAGSGYSKAESDARYAGAGSSYSKAEDDARFQPKGSYAPAGSSYTKAESDAKYTAVPQVVRGVFSIRSTAAGAGSLVSNPITYGVNLTTAPTPHFIDEGAATPAGCTGSASNPGAQPGHLCVFVSTNVNATAMNVYSAGGVSGSASPYGAYIGASSAAAGGVYLYGSWALGVSTIAPPGRPVEAPASGARDGR